MLKHATKLQKFDIRLHREIIGANSEADERGSRSSDMTLEATTKRRLFEPSLLVSSAADTLLTSGETHFCIFTYDKNVLF